MQVKGFRLFLASICSAFLAIGSIFTTNKAAVETKAADGNTILSVSPKSGYFTGSDDLQEVSWNSLDVANSGTEKVDYLVANTSIATYYSASQVYSGGKVVGARRDTRVGLFTNNEALKKAGFYVTAMSIKIAFSTDSTYETSSTDLWYIRLRTRKSYRTVTTDTNKLTLSQIRSIYGNPDSSGYYTIPLALGDTPHLVQYRAYSSGSASVESTIPYGLKTVTFTVNTSIGKFLSSGNYHSKLGFSYGTTNGVVTEINNVSIIFGLSFPVSLLNAAFSSITSITADIMCGTRDPDYPDIYHNYDDYVSVAGDSSNIIVIGDEAWFYFRISNIPSSAFGLYFQIYHVAFTGAVFFGDSETIDIINSDWLSVQDLVEAYQTTAASTLSEEQASLVDSFANFYSDALSN